jgi:hypothetical protein
MSATLRLLPLTILLVLLCAATAAAATVKIPIPAEGQVAVGIASVPKGKKVSLRVATAPAGVAIAGAAKRGRLAVAVTRRRGVGAAGSVSISVKGAKAKGLRSYTSALAGGTAPGAACTTLGALLGKPLQSAGIAAADLRAIGAAAAARLCGKPFPSGAPGVLARLGLGTTPSGSGGGSLHPGGGAPAPGGGGGIGGGAECANGIDDDHDGQVDAPSERKLRPDPGCMNANDPTEAGEVPVPAACAASSGAGVGDDQTVLQVGINDGCGTFTEVAVYAAPTSFSCTIFTQANNFACVIAHGQPFADTRNATDADQADIEIDLTGNASCGVPATIVLMRRNFEVAELVTPIARCGTTKPACSNGADDDSDGMTDARDATGATDPDPGCSGPADTSEDSEVGLPAGCTIDLATFDNDELFPGIAIAGCGAIKGAWFKPSAAPTDCHYAAGAADTATCTVTGATAGATFAATTADVLLATHTTTMPQCGLVTAAITLADGTVASARGDWC